MSRGYVLIVEDSGDVRKVMAEMISMMGFKPALASDGIDAWKKISDGAFDLVITDIGLPGMSGEELIRKMRKKGLNTPVILITGVGFPGTKDRFRDLANYSFVQKPFKIEELKSEISRLLKTAEFTGNCKN